MRERRQLATAAASQIARWPARTGPSGTQPRSHLMPRVSCEAGTEAGSDMLLRGMTHPDTAKAVPAAWLCCRQLKPSSCQWLPSLLSLVAVSIVVVGRRTSVAPAASTVCNVWQTLHGGARLRRRPQDDPR